MNRREALKAISAGLLGTASSALTISDPSSKATMVDQLLWCELHGVPDYHEFMRQQLGLIARSLMIPLEVFDGTEQTSNYSGARLMAERWTKEEAELRLRLLGR
jgi:hypothetical protein